MTADLLAIECTTEACSVALFRGGALVAGEFEMLGRGHAEALIPMVARLPGKGRAGRIVVGLGPGSFTGVRIGLAAARALALPWGSEVTGYPTLALIAVMACAERGAQPVLVAAEGGHGEWFVQPFDAEGRETAPLASLPPAQAATLNTPLVAGPQAAALVAQRGTGAAMVTWPDARAMMALPKHAFTTDLAPIYGRAPDAKRPV